MDKNKRAKISFPLEEGFIQLRPSLSAEIGRDPSIVFQYFLFILEGNTKYLYFDKETNSYWVHKSLNKITNDLYPYFKTDFVSTSSGSANQVDVSFDTAKKRISRIMDILTKELNLLHVTLFDVPGVNKKTHWYSINYQMCSILNGISVKWDFDPEIRRNEIFKRQSKESDLSLFNGTPGHKVVTPRPILGTPGHKVVTPRPENGTPCPTYIDNRKEKKEIETLDPNFILKKFYGFTEKQLTEGTKRKIKGSKINLEINENEIFFSIDPKDKFISTLLENYLKNNYKYLVITKKELSNV